MTGQKIDLNVVLRDSIFLRRKLELKEIKILMVWKMSGIKFSNLKYEYAIS